MYIKKIPWFHPAHGNHGLNNLESTVPEDTSTHVTVFSGHLI